MEAFSARAVDRWESTRSAPCARVGPEQLRALLEPPVRFPEAAPSSILVEINLRLADSGVTDQNNLRTVSIPLRMEGGVLMCGAGTDLEEVVVVGSLGHCCVNLRRRVGRGRLENEEEGGLKLRRIRQGRRHAFEDEMGAGTGVE